MNTITLPNKHYPLEVTKSQRKISMLNKIKKDMIKKKMSFVIGENVTTTKDGLVGFTIFRRLYKEDYKITDDDDKNEIERKERFSIYINKNKAKPRRYNIHFQHESRQHT